MPAIVEYIGSARTYVVRCPEHGDATPVTQFGTHRLTIFQGHNASSDARRYAAEHNAIQHAEHKPTITPPASPGGPYIIACACGFIAEASYPTAALVGAYDHAGTLR